MNLPPLLAELFLRRTMHDRFPAYLQVDRAGQLLLAEGCLDHYGLDGLERGASLPDEIAFLAGVLPVQQGGSVLPRIQLPSGSYADIHLFEGQSSDWVLLLDCTAEARSQAEIQQRANELKLLRSELSKGNDASYLTSVKVGHQVVSVMAAQLPGAILSSDQAVRYLRTVLDPIDDYGGVLLGLGGAAGYAAFGPLPSTAPPGRQAVSAALALLEASARWRKNASVAQPMVPAPSIGIATGECWVARATGLPGQTLVVTGRAHDLALKLYRGSNPGQIRVDARTAEQAANLGHRFLPEGPSTASALDEVRCLTFSGEP